MVKKVTSLFLKGLVAVLPLALTIYVVYWLGWMAESYMSRVFQVVLPETLYMPGLGIVAGFFIICLMGLVVNAWAVQRLLELFENVINRIPLIKTIYTSIQDMMSFFSRGEGDQFSKVVMVGLGEAEMRVIGFVTREDFEELSDEIGSEGDLAVYLPLSYQIGGYTVVIPEEKVQPVDISLDEAMRFALTAGVKRRKKSVRKITEDMSEL